MRLLAFFLLSLALILEASITTIPFVFLVLLAFVAFAKGKWLFVLGFIFGILLDLVGFRTLGTSSMFFIVVLFLVLLYQSKFEIATNVFILAASFLGVLGYLSLLGYHDNLIFQAILSSISALLLFKLIQRLERKGKTKEQYQKV